MKKTLGFILALGALLVPAFAVEWPPPVYNMPRTAISSETAAYALSGLFDTIRSIGNTGLLILGIIISVSLIGTIFRWLLTLGGGKKTVGKSRGEERNLKAEKTRFGQSSELREMQMEHFGRRTFKQK